MDEEIQTGEVQPQEVPQEQQPEAIAEEQLDPYAVLEQNKQLYARAKKAEEELKELKKKPQEQPQAPLQTNSPIPDDRLERLELRQDGYTTEEVEEIMSLGGKKALDNAIIKAGIEAARKQRRSLEATPTDTSRSPVYKKYTQAELQAMSVEELDKILPHANN